MRQLPYRQRKGLSPAENGITGQEHDRPGELSFTLRFEITRPQGCKVVIAWADFCPPTEGDALAVTKPVDDRDRSTIVPAGAVTDIDDEAVNTLEVTADLVQSGDQFPLFDVLQLEDPHVTQCPRSAVVKHPCLGLGGPPETIGDESFPRRLEELLDLPGREFLAEFGLFLCGEESLLSIPARFGFQL